jgi:hypothetical protein
MGKAADNEALKLSAMFYNNVAVAAIIAGVVIPAVGFYQHHETFISFIEQTPPLEILQFLLPAIVGLLAANLARARAHTMAWSALRERIQRARLEY